MMDKNCETYKNLERFAAEHGLTLEPAGEVGFGRACVGFIDPRGNYVDYNPYKHPDFEEVWPYDERLDAPVEVNSYHKHNCMAVLVDGEDDYDQGLEQLNQWVKHLEAQGTVTVEKYYTGAVGYQALTSGTIGYAIRIVDDTP